MLGKTIFRRLNLTSRSKLHSSYMKNSLRTGCLRKFAPVDKFDRSFMFKEESRRVSSRETSRRSLDYLVNTLHTPVIHKWMFSRTHDAVIFLFHERGFKTRPHRDDAAARDEIDRHVPERRHGGEKGGGSRRSSPSLSSSPDDGIIETTHAEIPQGRAERRLTKRRMSWE